MVINYQCYGALSSELTIGYPLPVLWCIVIRAYHGYQLSVLMQHRKAMHVHV